MATILLTWELGGGLGHTGVLTPLAKGLLKRGHRVWVVLKNLTGAREVFNHPNLSFLQAPTLTQRAKRHGQKPHTFAHILYDVGFGEAKGLPVRVEAWKNLFRLVKPDLIVFNHSPTAMLAARGFPARTAVVGTGFCCPPDVYPLPDLRTWEPADPRRLQADEDRLLERINALVQSQSQEPLERIGQLYREVDECLLTTIRELDHYPQRTDGRYLGSWTGVEGKPPEWPAAQGKRIFAYLKPFKTLRQLLTRLNELGHPTIVFSQQLTRRFEAEFRSATLRFETEPLDLEALVRQTDLAILNGTHGTTFFMLLGGVPSLQLPLYMEQAITARKIADLGAGLAAPLDRPGDMIRQLEALVSSDQCARGAQAVASRYADLRPAAAAEKAVDWLEALLAR